MARTYYAIGDVHGEAERLVELHAAILSDIAFSAAMRKLFTSATTSIAAPTAAASSKRSSDCKRARRFPCTRSWATTSN